MAYYLGRDLDIALTTEHTSTGLVVNQLNADLGNLQIAQRTWADGTAPAYSYEDSRDRDNLFAAPLRQVSDTVFGDLTESIDPDGQAAANETWDNRPDNIVGVDLSVSTQDEDVQFIGQRSILKAEVKKENSITLTRKKKDAVWNTAYDQARFGLDENGATGNGQYQPDFTGYGYRVYLKFNTDATLGETFILTNCCITEYAVTMSPDASQEETMTLVSYTNPIILSGTDSSSQVGAAVGGL